MIAIQAPISLLYAVMTAACSLSPMMRRSGKSVRRWPGNTSTIGGSRTLIRSTTGNIGKRQRTATFHRQSWWSLSRPRPFRAMPRRAPHVGSRCRMTTPRVCSKTETEAPRTTLAVVDFACVRQKHQVPNHPAGRQKNTPFGIVVETPISLLVAWKVHCQLADGARRCKHAASFSASGLHPIDLYKIQSA